MTFTIEEDFAVLDKFKESQTYIPLSVALIILGFDACIHSHSSYMSYIKNNFIDQPKFGFIENSDYIFKCSDQTYERTLSFSVDGFKKLSLVYNESPRYTEILRYFCSK